MRILYDPCYGPCLVTLLSALFDLLGVVRFLKSASSIRTNLSSEIKIITLLIAGFLHLIMLSKSAYSVRQLEFKPHLALLDSGSSVE